MEDGVRAIKIKGYQRNLSGLVAQLPIGKFRPNVENIGIECDFGSSF